MQFDIPDEAIQAQLEQYREAFEAGESDALMLAALFCAKCKVPVPDWVDWELHQAWHRFVKRDCDGLGEAFGIQWPKGSHKAAYRKKRKLRFAVYNRINELHLKQEWHWVDGQWCQATNPEWPIGETLFSKVGQEFGIGKKLASEYYYSVKAIMPNEENN